MPLICLNLGSCDVRKPGYLSVDRVPPAEVIVDLRKPWPWADSSVKAIDAHHIIEHLPDRIHTMNELHRILIPGGLVDIIVPSATKGAGYVQDPTHVSPWCLNSFCYYDHKDPDWKRFHESSGITAAFEIRVLENLPAYKHRYEDVVNIHAVLVAVK